jgi:hypothetical protein
MEGSHAVDHRADIYSLGVVFYEMLTGEVPMGHFEPPSQKVEVDVRLDQVVLRSLERHPQRRYQHASDVKTDVEAISRSRDAAKIPVAISAAKPSNEIGRVGALLSSGTGWVILLSLLAAGSCLLEWQFVEFRGDDGTVLTSMRGYRSRCGQITAAISIVLVGVVLLDGVKITPIPWWRMLITIVAGVSMVAMLGAQTYGLWPMNSHVIEYGQEWGGEINQRFADAVASVTTTELRDRITTSWRAGAYLTLGLAIGLILIGTGQIVHRLRYNTQLESQANRSAVAKPFPWSEFLIGFAVLLSALGLIGFAMYWADSAWPLLGLLLPCFILGFMVGAEDADDDLKRMLPATLANVAVTFAGGAALLVYAIVLTNSALPLWAIAAWFVSICAGGGAGVEMAEDEKKKQKASPGADEQEAPSKGKELVEYPALLMTITGGLLTLFLFLALSEVTAEGLWTYAPCVVGPVILVAGLYMGQLRFYWLAVVGSMLCFPAAMFPYWGWFALAIGAFSLWRLMQPEVRAAFRLRAAEDRGVADERTANVRKVDGVARLVHNPAWGLIITGVISWVTIPLAFAIPFIDTANLNATQRMIFQISFGVFPLVIGTVMALAGFRMKRLEGYRLAMLAAVLPIVVLLFKLVGLSFGTLAIGPADLVGAPVGLWVLVVLTRSDVKAVFNHSLPGQGSAPRVARGTLGRAWDEWWADRDRWFTRTALAVLVAVHIACLGMFLTLRGGGGYDSGRPSAWHHVGWPTPWFVYERGVESNVSFRRTINLLSSSIVIAGIGMLAWYAFWRVQLVRDVRHARLWQTIGSPTAVLIVWILAGAAFAWLGVRDADRLYESMRAQTPPVESQKAPEAPGS